MVYLKLMRESAAKLDDLNFLQLNSSALLTVKTYEEVQADIGTVRAGNINCYQLVFPGMCEQVWKE